MFGIGVGELFVIFVIAIVVIGPNKLPEVARTVGKFIAMAKRTSNQLREQMHAEVQKFQEMAEVKEFKESIESEMYSIHDAAETYIKKEIDEEERRLEEEARGIEQAFTAETERMLASGVPEESSATDPAPGPTSSTNEVVHDGNGAASMPAAQPAGTAMASGSSEVTGPAHENGSNGSTSGSPDVGAGSAEIPAKPVS